MERTLKPSEEIWISIAGPLANALIALGLFTYLANTHQAGAGAAAIKPSDLMTPSDVNLLGLLGFGNLLLVAMNLLPAFPMDGGRILRALLTYVRPEDEATRMAAWMGRMLAISMGLYGLLASQFMLVFFALFVYLGAALLVIVAALFSSTGKKTPAQQAAAKGQPPQPVLQDNACAILPPAMNHDTMWRK